MGDRSASTARGAVSIPRPAAAACRRGRRSPSGTDRRDRRTARSASAGSMLCQKTSSSFVVADPRRVVLDLHRLGMAGAARRYLLVGRIAACAHRCSPTVTDSTPSRFSKGGSMHQKQPPAKVALARRATGCRRLRRPPVRGQQHRQRAASSSAAAADVVFITMHRSFHWDVAAPNSVSPGGVDAASRCLASRRCRLVLNSALSGSISSAARSAALARSRSPIRKATFDAVLVDERVARRELLGLVERLHGAGIVAATRRLAGALGQRRAPAARRRRAGPARRRCRSAARAPAATARTAGCSAARCGSRRSRRRGRPCFS